MSTPPVPSDHPAGHGSGIATPSALGGFPYSYLDDISLSLLAQLKIACVGSIPGPGVSWLEHP